MRRNDVRMEVVCTVFEKFETSIEGREKQKRHDFISSQNFFRLLQITFPSSLILNCGSKNLTRARVMG